MSARGEELSAGRLGRPRAGPILAGWAAAAVLIAAALWRLDEARSPHGPPPSSQVGLEAAHEAVTLNTTRLGADDPIVTAVAVSQFLYPATEARNRPGAVVLANRGRLAEVMVAASRFLHAPVDAPLLYADEDNLPAMTRAEMLRLSPKGVMTDGNVQVYLVGTIAESVGREIGGLGFKVRRIRGEDPVDLAVRADDWDSTQRGDHPNDVVIANLDRLEPAVPSVFWNAHASDGLAFVTGEGVPEATVKLLRRRLHGPWIYVFGDASAVSEETVRALTRHGRVARIPGATPAQTSARFAGFLDEGRNWGGWVAQGARSFGWGSGGAGRGAVFVALDGPGGWANALPAAALSRLGKPGPGLVLEDGRVSREVAAWLEAVQPYPTVPRQSLFNHGLIVGGERTISWELQAEIDRWLEASAPGRDGGKP